MRLFLVIFWTMCALAPSAFAQSKIPTTATPAVWTLKDRGGDLTFLGSIHLLPQGLSWRTAQIDAAFQHAQIVVFEAPVDAGAGPSAEIMNRLGQLKGGQSLSKIVPPALWRRLEDAAWSVSFPARNLEPFEPWLAAVTLEVMLYINKGFSPWLGVDLLLEEEARQAGKKTEFLESVEEQLSYLAGMPRSVGIKMLEQAVIGIETKPDLVFELVGAWAKGDPEALWAVADDSMNGMPEIEDALLIRRNKNWIPKLEKMIRSGRPHLVVVGAAHLAGPDSVIKMLRTKGYKIEGP